MGVGFGGYGKETGAVGARAHRAARTFSSVERVAILSAGLDMLEARLRVSHPDLDWLDGLRAFKAEADAVIAGYRTERRKPG